MSDESRNDTAPMAPPPAEQNLASQTAGEPPASGPGIAPPPPVNGWGAQNPPPPSGPYGGPHGGPAYGHTPPPHRPGVGAAIVAALLTALVVGAFAGLAGGLLGAQLIAHSGVGVVGGGGGTVTVVPSKTDEPVVAAAAAAVPAVVNIDITEGVSSGGQNGLPNSHPSVPLSGNGSGVAFRKAPDGGTYILTNNHVVENAQTISVKSPSGKSWKGTVVGRDADNDIAVVKIPGQLPLIQLGSSKNLVVGQLAVAIGSPYGLEHSVTSGVISAINRSLSDVGSAGQSQPLVDTIQTDASINPGNSGGALVDRAGKLIGINTAIYTSSGSGSGIGFAIPVDTAIRVADQLISGGKVTHPFIGLVGTSVTPLIAQQKKLTVQQGALVESLVAGQGAEKAGVKPGDVVTAVDGVPVTSMTDLVAQVRKHAIGTDAVLTVIRDGKTITLRAPVSDRPSNMGSTVPSTPSSPSVPPTQ